MNFISDFRLFILFLSFGIFDVFSSTSISAVILSDWVDNFADVVHHTFSTVIADCVQAEHKVLVIEVWLVFVVIHLEAFF